MMTRTVMQTQMRMDRMKRETALDRYGSNCIGSCSAGSAVILKSPTYKRLIPLISGVCDKAHRSLPDSAGHQ